MAEFSRLMITGKGQALIAKMIAGSKGITFTRVAASDAVYELAQLEGLESLTGIKQISVVSKITRINEVTVKVETAFSNTELTEGYHMRALGLYAEDPEEGEILYAAAMEISGNCYMPAYGGMTVSGAYIQLVTTVGNAENVSLVVDNSAQATIGDIKELQEQIDGMNGIVEGVAAQAAMNATKLGCLERIGGSVMKKDVTGNGTVSASSRIFSLFEIPKTEFKEWDDHTFYLYVLEPRRGRNVFTIRPTDNSIRELTGYLYVSMFIDGSYAGASQVAPIVRSSKWDYTAPIFMMDIYGPASDGGIVFQIAAYIMEKNESGEWVEITDELSISASLSLGVYKLGYILAAVEEASTGTVGSAGGTSNYNLLMNKPSINNVTLQGNLTTEQLGIKAGSGDAKEMTYEEALAILNEDKEVSGL